MTVRKFLLSIFLFIFLMGFSQEKPPYPKDTIYIKYEKENDRKIIDWNYKDNIGIYFSIKESKKNSISTFASYKSKFDTLNIDYLKKIEFSDLNEINKRWNEWIKENNRPPVNRNAVFVTYVIERISEERIVRCPVVWRNEGVTD